jgi:conjugal transfer mating pair stabilization protein TraN
MMRIAALLTLWFVLLIPPIAIARDCNKVNSVCIDSTPCKNISGVNVCLADIGQACWEYEDTYTCLKPNAINYCRPFIDAQPACWQTNSQCSQTDSVFNSGCMQYTQTWRCGDPSMPTPANTTRLSDTYTLVSSNYDTAPCQSASSSPNCSLAESVCTSTTPLSPLPPGIDPAAVAPDGCYQRKDTYACMTGTTDNECARYSSNPACTLTSTATCSEEDKLNGQCLYQEQTYRCETKPASTQTVMNCAGQQFCMGGNCFDRGYTPDKDFGKAAAMMETARQGGVYGDANNLFGGKDDRCKVKLFGLANCCKTNGGGGGMNNGALMGVAMSAAGQTLKYGSYYVYDALWDYGGGGAMLQKGIGALTGAAEAAAKTPSGLAVDGFSPTLSMYGFSVSFGAAPAGATVLGSTGGLTFSFDPTSLAISVAIMVITDLLSCDQGEQMLGLKRGQNLCHSVGTYCSSKLNLLVAKICIEKTQSYCCYNSRLARIINEQGRAQIGKGWGGAESPQCGGFTQSEFASLDFATMDLSEFIGEIMSHATLPDTGVLNARTQSQIQTKMQNYYSQ